MCVFWHCRAVKTRFYDEEKINYRCQRTETTGKHPLLRAKSEITTKTSTTPAKKTLLSAYSDPLSATLEGLDPLSQFAAKDDLDLEDKTESWKTDEISNEWLKQRTDILSRFTTSEKLSITSSFLQGGEKRECLYSKNDACLFRKNLFNYFSSLICFRWIGRNQWIIDHCFKHIMWCLMIIKL